MLKISQTEIYTQIIPKVDIQKLQTSKMDVKTNKKLQELSKEFESIMVKTMLDIAIKDEGLFPQKDPANKIYGSFYKDELSKEVSGGYGFSDVIYDYLKQSIKNQYKQPI